MTSTVSSRTPRASRASGVRPRGSGVAEPEPALPYRAAARVLLRDTMLDAVGRLLSDRPWAQITMSDVARAAGVSRQTLYKELGTRDEFAQQFVIREGTRFMNEVEQAVLARLHDVHGAIEAGLEVFLTMASEDPLLRMLLEDDGTGGMLPLLTTQSRPVFEWAFERLSQAMHAGWPDIDSDAAEVLADTFVRLALSYVTMPRSTPRESAQMAAGLLAPTMERAVGGAGATP